MSVVKLTLKDGTVIPYKILPTPRPNEVPLLMVQGLSGSMENWFNLPEELAKRRPVVVFNNRGISQRPVPEGPYPPELMASDAVALADHLGWKQFHLFGISMGGAISQMLALNYPQRVKKLIIGCTSPCFFQDADPEAIQALLPPTGKVTMEEAMKKVRKGLEINFTTEQCEKFPHLIDEMLDMEIKLKKPARGIMNQSMGLAEFDSRERLKDLKHQTLIITGSQDRLVRYTHSVLLNELIPNSTLRFLPKVGHLFYFPDPHPTARLISDFLDGPEVAASKL